MRIRASAEQLGRLQEIYEQAFRRHLRLELAEPGAIPGHLE
jgi:hypothetical protein